MSDYNYESKIAGVKIPEEEIQRVKHINESTNDCSVGRHSWWNQFKDYPIPEGTICDCGMVKYHESK